MVKVCAICDIEGCRHIREADKAPDLSPVERLARQICASENEIWDEVPQSYRDGWMREAALAARVDALTKERDAIGRELNLARYGQPDFAWSIHLAAMDELRDERDTALARVDALTKERDEAQEEIAEMKVELAKLLAQTTLARGNEAALAHAIKAERDTALARLGAVERETLGRAALELEHHHTDEADSTLCTIWQERILELPLDQDAAAALDRAIAKAVQEERRACAKMCEGYEHEAEGAFFAGMILARGAKQDDE